MSETPAAPGMSDQDLVDFDRLIAQEGHSVEGQVAKMDLIEKIIRERELEKGKQVIADIRREQPELEGQKLQEEVLRRHQLIHIYRMNLGDGRFNLIVEKGDGDPDNEDRSVYRVMIPAHIDTVEAGQPGEMIHDIANADRVRGEGVYDMQAAVLNSIDLATSAKIPKGMKAYFVFTPDEETNSIGGRALINHWDVFPMIDVVLSSEIGPLTPRAKDSNVRRLITARAGRIKFIGTLDIDHRSQGHGSEAGMPNASYAVRHFLNAIEDRFYRGYAAPTPGDSEPPQQQTHPLLGKEIMEDGDMHGWKTRKGYLPPDRGEYDFAIRMVPPSSRASYEEFFKRWARGIAKAGKWKEYGINNQFGVNPHVASYSPFELPADHPVVQVSSAVMQRIFGVAPELVGAPSVSDECDYAEAGKPVITVPYEGDEAHHPDEWVSLSSVLEVRNVLRALLEDEDGFRALMKAQSQ